MICDALSTDCANSQVLYWFLFSSSLACLVLTFRYNSFCIFLFFWHKRGIASLKESFDRCLDSGFPESQLRIAYRNLLVLELLFPFFLVEDIQLSIIPGLKKVLLLCTYLMTSPGGTQRANRECDLLANCLTGVAMIICDYLKLLMGICDHIIWRLNYGQWYPKSLSPLQN